MFDWCLSSYAFDIEKHLKKKELMKVFLFQSPQLSHRKKLVDYLIEVGDKLKSSTVVVHLGIRLMDFFMDHHSISVDKLEVVAITCLLIAAKYEEKDDKIPHICQLKYFCQEADKEELARLELMILSHFNWNVSEPTAAHFSEFYFIFLLVKGDNAAALKQSDRELQTSLVETMIYYLNTSLKEVVMLKFKASQVAAACVLASRISHRVAPLWPSLLKQLTGYSYPDLAPCSAYLISCREPVSKRIFETDDQGYDSMSPDNSKKPKLSP